MNTYRITTYDGGGNPRHAYYSSFEAANAVCEEIFQRTGHILGIEEVFAETSKRVDANAYGMHSKSAYDFGAS